MSKGNDLVQASVLYGMPEIESNMHVRYPNLYIAK